MARKQRLWDPIMLFVVPLLMVLGGGAIAASGVLAITKWANGDSDFPGFFTVQRWAAEAKNHGFCLDLVPVDSRQSEKAGYAAIPGRFYFERLVRDDRPLIEEGSFVRFEGGKKIPSCIRSSQNFLSSLQSRPGVLIDQGEIGRILQREARDSSNDGRLASWQTSRKFASYIFPDIKEWQVVESSMTKDYPGIRLVLKSNGVRIAIDLAAFRRDKKWKTEVVGLAIQKI